MCTVCNERKSGKSRDVSVDDLKRSRSPLGPHRSKGMKNTDKNVSLRKRTHRAESRRAQTQMRTHLRR